MSQIFNTHLPSIHASSGHSSTINLSTYPPTHPPSVLPSITIQLPIHPLSTHASIHLPPIDPSSIHVPSVHHHPLIYAFTHPPSIHLAATHQLTNLSTLCASIHYNPFTHPSICPSTRHPSIYPPIICVPSV